MSRLLITLLILSALSFYSKAQDFGYFGKKHSLSLHGNWFFRAVPQVFYKEALYHFQEGSNDFKEQSLRNHVWQIGASYKRSISNRHAWGIQVDYGVRNLGTPNFNWTNSSLVLSPWNHEANPEAVWSAVESVFVNVPELELSRMSFSNRNLLFTWSRARTATVFPLGLISTLGLGLQHSRISTERSVYARSLTTDSLGSSWSTNQRILSLERPSDLEHDYLGLVWMWDLSLNYALNKRFLLSIGSDIRGVFGVFQLKNFSAIESHFSPFDQSVPSLEALVYGRNFRKEIAREMRFQNTLKLGICWMF